MASANSKQPPTRVVACCQGPNILTAAVGRLVSVVLVGGADVLWVRALPSANSMRPDVSAINKSLGWSCGAVCRIKAAIFCTHSGAEAADGASCNCTDSRGESEAVPEGDTGTATTTCAVLMSSKPTSRLSSPAAISASARCRVPGRGRDSKLCMEGPMVLSLAAARGGNWRVRGRE